MQFNIIDHQPSIKSIQMAKNFLLHTDFLIFGSITFHNA